MGVQIAVALEPRSPSSLGPRGDMTVVGLPPEKQSTARERAGRAIRNRDGPGAGQG